MKAIPNGDNDPIRVSTLDDDTVLIEQVINSIELTRDGWADLAETLDNYFSDPQPRLGELFVHRKDKP